MYPYIEIRLPSYGVLAFIGFFFAVMLIYFRLEKYEITFTVFLKSILFGGAGLLVGSKVLYAVTEIPWLIENFTFSRLIMLIPTAGFVFYGGLLGLISGLYIFTRKDNELRKRIISLYAPAIPLFHGFGRIGCFLAGCCYGKTFVTPLQVGPFIFDSVPVQLFEAAFEFCLFVVILIFERKHTKINLLRLYLIPYAIFRFADEFLRGDIIRGLWFGLSTSQWISLLIFIVCIARIVKEIKSKGAVETAPAEDFITHESVSETKI